MADRAASTVFLILREDDVKPRKRAEPQLIHNPFPKESGAYSATNKHETANSQPTPLNRLYGKSVSSRICSEMLNKGSQLPITLCVRALNLNSPSWKV